MNVQEVARRLCEAMKAKGFSQMDISKATGVHQSQISRFCAGNFARGGQNLRRVCEQVDVKLDEPVAPTQDRELQSLFDQLIVGLDLTERRTLLAALRALLKLR